ncbi:type II toxin-antitoxin system VapB family antitoxin [Mesorhizobium sp. AaZ16]|uniref:type II toxin-antitoxin system VapB family antitoxin n=1 Tax=Mesorhizobium sp. AaZ16 TaxID=3402289 RepID=UPI00374ED9DF
MAKRLAEERKLSLDDAVIGALQAELGRKDERPLAERVRPIVERLRAASKPGGRDMTKDEIDAMWGHE